MTGRLNVRRPNLMESNPLETLIRRWLEQGASITVLDDTIVVEETE